MQKHLDLTRQRVLGFAERLFQQIYPHRAPLSLEVYPAPGRISYLHALQGAYRPAQTGERFGPLWSTHWFHIIAVVPPGWQDCEVHLLWNSASEACVWQHGVPLQGLAGSFNGWQDQPIRTEFCLAQRARVGETFELYIEMACNGLFGLESQAHVARMGELLQAEIAVFDRDAWDLYWDLKVIADLAQHLPANTPRGGQALAAANAMVNAIQLSERSTWGAARQLAARFFSAQNGHGQHNLSAIGHAHMDVAWLWPVAETKRKCARTFATALRYMETYPEYKFTASQAQLYQWVKTEYPGLYACLKEKVSAEQFIPVGGTWVEPDCNLPSGESLVRQFLYGQRFFDAEFGERCQVFWNPDVFGYSGALPQIMKLAGIRYFLTQKLSWNQFNKPASHTFLWEGIDGSRVLTHFPPADTYNSRANVEEVLFSVSNFKDHERARESYLLFGYGDGGGGPTLGMLEQLRRMGDVDALPRTQIRSPQEFFERCAADLQDPLVQSGELYFELHRGTYTSQARNKQFNRQAELTLRDAEMLSALAWAKGQQAYPSEALEMLWKETLTNQFHDIIPGSSIHEVYTDSTLAYDRILAQAGQIREQALRALVPDGGPTSQVAAFNTLGFPRTEVAELPAGIPGSQRAYSGRSLGLVSAAAIGYTVQEPAKAKSGVSVSETTGGFVLENESLKAILSHQGHLVSLEYKPTGRECIEPEKAGNLLVLYEDLPNAWDAWDVDIFHLEKGQAVSGARKAEILEAGPLRAAVAFEFGLSLRSTLLQVVSLDALARRLDFSCEVDWHEQHTFLKVEFPVNVHSAFATYEIQFGHLQRPTHFNTPQDLARFEVPAQRWADLSEPDFGVALLNDCKYGYSVQGNVMRLSLLRSPTYPDATADQGRHTFRFALWPHAGPPQTAGVTEEAYRFNVPLLVSQTDEPGGQKSFLSVSHPAIVIDTLKKAEDSQAIILRLYEARGSRGRVCITSCLSVRAVWRVNLLEDELAPLEWQDGVELDFRPFEIISLQLDLDMEESNTI